MATIYSGSVYMTGNNEDLERAYEDLLLTGKAENDLIVHKHDGVLYARLCRRYTEWLVDWASWFTKENLTVKAAAAWDREDGDGGEYVFLGGKLVYETTFQVPAEGESSADRTTALKAPNQEHLPYVIELLQALAVATYQRHSLRNYNDGRAIIN